MKLFKKKLSNIDRIRRIEDFIDNEVIEKHNALSDAFGDLSDELATNGVVRRQVALEKENKSLRNALESLRMYVQDEFKTIATNGVADAINKLNDEVFKERKESTEYVRLANVYFSKLWGYDTEQKNEEPTLAGKVEAILEHLKLNVEVAPEEVKKAKPVAKKKPVSKKKGRK